MQSIFGTLHKEDHDNNRKEDDEAIGFMDTEEKADELVKKLK